jgi:hypothetical protein
LNDGHLVYTLDDAYIHLSLAENIAHGHYGVNAGEYSAPSSSIAWPFLMAPFTLLASGHVVPLVVNFLLGVVVVLQFRKIALATFPPAETNLPRSFPTLLVLFLIPGTNLIGLTFNGMEHSLQLVLALLLLLGFLRGRGGAKLPWWFYAAIVVGPLVRYENLTLSLGAVGYLVWRREYGPALLCTAVPVVLIGGFSLFLLSLNLGSLPTSVIAKTPHLSSDAQITDVLFNLKRNITDRQGAVLWIGLLFLVNVLFQSRRNGEERVLAAWASGAVVLHLLIGRFGWYQRYEIYIWTTALLMTAYLYRHAILRLIGDGRNFRTAVFAAAFLFGACFPYALVVITNPIGSNNIYQQQFQMRRFATEFFPNPVAANDIGWLSFRNDEYVLDLWGLASKAALAMHGHQDMPGWVDTEWIRNQARRHDVKVAMLFERWFPNLPEDWIPVGDLYLGRRKVSAARHVVTFYVVGAENLPRILGLLREYEATLPEGVRFVFRDVARGAEAARS